jgi:hypothetical protein
MLDDCVGAGEYQRGVIVLESHEVGRFTARSADLDYLACPLWLTHDAATHVKPVSDGCLHAPPPLIRVRSPRVHVPWDAA